jgi:allantoin racemase
MVDEFLVAALANVAEGAEIVIPAVGVVTTLLARHGIHEAAPGVPILNTVAALVKMGEAAVKMRKLFGGSWTSRRAMYAAPPTDQIDELRKYYGPVYPWLKSR